MPLRPRAGQSPQGRMGELPHHRLVLDLPEAGRLLSLVLRIGRKPMSLILCAGPREFRHEPIIHQGLGCPLCRALDAVAELEKVKERRRR